MENIHKNREIPTSEKKASNLAKQGITSPSTETALTNDAKNREILNKFVEQNIQSIFHSQKQEHTERDQACLDEGRNFKRRRLGSDEISQDSSTGFTGEMNNLTLAQDLSPLRNREILTENSNKWLSNDTRRAEGEHLSPHTTDWKDHITDWKDHIGPLVALVESIQSLKTQQKEEDAKLVSLNETIVSLQEKKQKYVSQSEDFSQQIKEYREYMQGLDKEHGDTWLPSHPHHDMPMAVSTRNQYNQLDTDVKNIEENRHLLIEQEKGVQDQLIEVYERRDEISNNQLQIDCMIKAHEQKREQIHQKYSSITTNLIESAYNFPPGESASLAREALQDIFPTPLNEQLRDFFQKKDTWSTIFVDAHTLLSDTTSYPFLSHPKVKQDQKKGLESINKLCSHSGTKWKEIRNTLEVSFNLRDSKGLNSSLIASLASFQEYTPFASSTGAQISNVIAHLHNLPYLYALDLREFPPTSEILQYAKNVCQQLKQNQLELQEKGAQLDDERQWSWAHTILKKSYNAAKDLHQATSRQSTDKAAVRNSPASTQDQTYNSPFSMEIDEDTRITNTKEDTHQGKIYTIPTDSIQKLKDYFDTATQMQLTSEQQDIQNALVQIGR